MCTWPSFQMVQLTGRYFVSLNFILRSNTIFFYHCPKNKTVLVNWGRLVTHPETSSFHAYSNLFKQTYIQNTICSLFTNLCVRFTTNFSWLKNKLKVKENNPRSLKVLSIKTQTASFCFIHHFFVLARNIRFKVSAHDA